MAISRWLDYGGNNDDFGVLDMEAISQVAASKQDDMWVLAIRNTDGRDVITGKYNDRDSAMAGMKAIADKLKAYEAKKAKADAQ